MLTTLSRFGVYDAGGRRAAVTDFSIDLLADEHPPVTGVYFRRDMHRSDDMFVPWERLDSIDWQAHRFHVADLDAQAVADARNPPMAERVLLRRDILDALILDLQNRRATRANDLALQLEETGPRLRLVAADTSFVAMLRRIARTRMGRRVVERKLYDWKYIEFLRGDPGAVAMGAGYNRRITRLPAGEIARLVDALPYLHAAELLTLLPDKLAADTLEAMSAHRQLQVYEELSEAQGLALLNLMAPDLAADLIGRLHTETARTLLGGLVPAQSARIVELLRYPEDTVGSIMTNDVLTVPAALTVAEARAALHERLREPDFIFFIYVVDDAASRRLRGVVTLRALVTAGDSQRMTDLMNPYLVTLHALDPVRDAAYRVLNSHLVALPVIGREGRLLGAVTIDAAISMVAPPSWSAEVVRVFS